MTEPVAMGDLDEISLTLGKLLNGQEEAVRKQEAIFRNIDEIKGAMSEIKGSVATVTAGHTALKVDVDENVKPHIEDFKKTKQRGIGLMAGVGLGGGASGATIATLLGKWIGGGS